MSRRRMPRDARAWSADVAKLTGPSCEVLSVGNGSVPHLVPNGQALSQELRAGANGKPARAAILGEHAQHELVVIEQPVVVFREADVIGQVTRQVAHVLASLGVEAGDVQPPAGVRGVRGAHQPNSLELDASRGHLAEKAEPVLMPGVVVRLTALPPAEGLILSRDVVGVFLLQVEGTLAPADYGFKLLIVQWLHGLPSGASCASSGRG